MHVQTDVVCTTIIHSKQTVLKSLKVLYSAVLVHKCSMECNFIILRSVINESVMNFCYYVNLSINSSLYSTRCGDVNFVPVTCNTCRQCLQSIVVM